MPSPIFISRRSKTGSMLFPLTIPGLKRWFDAGLSSADAGGVDGTAVGTFYDRAGSNDPATASGSARPKFWAEPGLGNQPSLRFDGTDDVMVCTSTAGLIKHVFAVVRYDGASFADYDGLLTDLFNPGVLVGDASTTNFYDFGGNYRLNKVDSAGRAAPMNAFGIVTVEYSTGWAFTPQIGSDRSFGTRFGPWRVADLLLYDNVLSTTNRDGIENFLSTKHSL